MNAPTSSESSAFAHAAVAPLWQRTGPPTGGRRPRPQLWRHREIRPLLDLVADDVPLEVAERRVLLFVNEALADVESTSNTLQANVQLVRPGESAPAHRHTMTAIRFGIEGSDVITMVDGVSVTIEPGDLVLTPSMSWHEHRHDGDQPVVWLDVLDRPLVEALGQVVFERAPAGSEPPHARGSSTAPAAAESLRFPWQRTDEALTRAVAANPRHATHGTVVEYRNPTTDTSVTTTIAVRAHRLEPTQSEALDTTTATRIFHVRSGTGQALIDDVTITWERGDTFIVPPSTPALITPTGDTADLVSFDDSPALHPLALLR